MKKILTITFLAAASTVHAQGLDRELQGELLRSIVIMSVFILIAFFILTFLKNILDNRLKNKILDKGISDTLSSSLLNNHPKENVHSTIKWFCLLAATGAGLLIVYYTLPLHIHSLAIMAFSIAIGFLGYYFFLKQSDGQ